jgi:hypothetical protein
MRAREIPAIAVIIASLVMCIPTHAESINKRLVDRADPEPPVPMPRITQMYGGCVKILIETCGVRREPTTAIHSGSPDLSV